MGTVPVFDAILSLAGLIMNTGAREKLGAGEAVPLCPFSSSEMVPAHCFLADYQLRTS